MSISNDVAYTRELYEHKLVTLKCRIELARSELIQQLEEGAPLEDAVARFERDTDLIVTNCLYIT